MKNVNRRLGFSLIEVVVAVGIFAVGIVGVIGLFAPTTKNVAGVADADSSTRVVTAIQSYLKEVASTSTGFSTTLPDKFGAGYVFYATKGGDKIIYKNDTGASTTIPDKDRFFEFSLTRNTDLSPVSGDTTAGFLAFTISLRWPAYDGLGVALADNQKSTLIVPAAITR